MFDDQSFPFKSSFDVDTLLGAVATEFGCDKKSILVKGQKKNAARDVAMYLARELTGESGKKLGKRLGSISGSGVTMQYKRFSNRLKRQKGIAIRVKKIKDRIVNCSDVTPYDRP